MPGGNLKAHVEQDLALRVVMKIDMLKTNHAAGNRQGARPRLVLHLGVDREQGEHLFHIRQRVFDLAVNKAQKMQGQINLNHVGIHQHQIAQRHGALRHVMRRQKQQHRAAHRDDQALPGI